MSSNYSKQRSNADDDLTDRLQASIYLVKERKRKMATRKKAAAGTKQRASVGRERKLALALRGLMDAISDNPDNVTGEVDAATVVLTGLGYADLEGIPRRLRRLNEQLKTAVESGDGAEIARLGNELSRAQQGKPPLKSPAPPVAKKSPRSGGATRGTASIATETDDAGDAVSE